MWATNVTLAGQNYHKMAMFARFNNEGYVNQSTFDRITARYVNPVSVSHWESKLQDVRRGLQGKDLVLAGAYMNTYATPRVAVVPRGVPY